MNMPVRLAVNFLLAFSLSAVFYAPKTDSVRKTSIELGEFFGLIKELSEPEGYFDSDNLVSNERAYLKVLPDLKRLDVSGGAYLGVGPDQNYSYIAHVKPQIAFIIDIRRQNALQHLYFKALFQLSPDRIRYLERLFGKRIDGPAKAHGVSDLLRLMDASAVDSAFARTKLLEAIRVIQAWKPGLYSEDYESIRFIARAFMADGPDLKFTSYNRPPRPHYPSYRQLLEETDSEGRQSNYLASEEAFTLIKTMHRENRIVPVIGDLAGSHALLSIGEELRRRRIALSCFYVSNVEFYLFGGRRWDPYIRNLARLPRQTNSFLIRSYARYWRRDAVPMPGYYMGMIVQSMQQFLADERAGRNTTYWSLILRSGQH